ncbi:MAG: hypothetical protein M1829_006386 [Trizodia sp. TS-e1964]|nr:MAG: hypothetical protein M1829_006386 [Trizodia sp. TS-e1964]
MHKHHIPNLLYAYLFPGSRATDPGSFSVHLTRHLVPEVRIETATFYGTLDCIEARYPGLDYSHPPHRLRLGRYPWHKRLFAAFDALGLTRQEISSLCRWEGTKWARERYEREEDIKVVDTTGDDILPWVEPYKEEQLVISPSHDLQGGCNLADERVAVEIDNMVREGCLFPVLRGHDAGEESEEEVQSIGLELNQRLIAATAAGGPGAGIIMDEAWEQWFKEHAERGTLPNIQSALNAGRTIPPSTTTTTISAPLLAQPQATPSRPSRYTRFHNAL